jgi:hypothetical protein
MSQLISSFRLQRTTTDSNNNNGNERRTAAGAWARGSGKGQPAATTVIHSINNLNKRLARQNNYRTLGLKDESRSRSAAATVAPATPPPTPPTAGDSHSQRRNGNHNRVKQLRRKTNGVLQTDAIRIHAARELISVLREQSRTEITIQMKVETAD